MVCQLIPIAAMLIGSSCSIRMSRKPASRIHALDSESVYSNPPAVSISMLRARQQAVRAMPPLVVDDVVVDDERAAVRQRLRRLAQQELLGRQVPVVQDASHHQHVGLRQIVAQEVARIES